MENIIPYEKEIEFDSNIYEITSISLEHQEDIEEDIIKGKFVVSGEYKAHQISINKEEFNEEIPFEIELGEDIDKNSIKIDINDFTYDIKDNRLIVKIDLLFKAKEIKIIEEELDREINELIEDKKEIVDDIKEEILEDSTIVEEDNNTYVTYHVYVVLESDTIEDICKKFNVSKDILYKYNEFDELKVNDKLLIPAYDE